MNFPAFSPSSASCRRAFTLLELLVVISIIAVLAGILLPVANGVMDRAKKAEAKALMASVVTAVKSYQADYGVYPVDPGTATTTSTPVDTTFGTDAAADPSSGKGGHNYLLFDVLRAMNWNTALANKGSTAWAGLNSRRVTYFENKDVKNSASPRSGFIPVNAKLSGADATTYKVRDLIDPWGGLYCVRIDTSYSDKLMNPYPASGDKAYTGKNSDTDKDTETDETKLLRTPVAVWSPGKDLLYGDKSGGALSTATDDVVSWQ